MDVFLNQEAPNGVAKQCHFCISYDKAIQSAPWTIDRTDGFFPAEPDLANF